MTVVFIDGSKRQYSNFAKVSCDKEKNELYINETLREYVYPLDLVEIVNFEE